ncbi:hypothetical protein DEO72_LG7g1004 [Vigna unguiculata]|uniref:Uncharacterized protein n=1 Tax=Vigna unguiculata TaxID=3917 RepID=A0A4D6ME56_VIGUN|nr:hypothetical protein DEO72_LG7g1004 [Vigna unguiculata]
MKQECDEDFGLNEHDCIVNLHLFGVFGARAMAKLYKFHPSDSFSPRREFQESIQCSYSSNSLKRPRLGLGKIQSRLGEIGSPKRGLAQARRARLSEMTRLNEHDCIVNLHLFGVFGARAMAKLYKFHPSDSFSPRREFQESIQCSYSSNSLKRPRSRSGEESSPKRDDEVQTLLHARLDEVD